MERGRVGRVDEKGGPGDGQACIRARIRKHTETPRTECKARLKNKYVPLLLVDNLIRGRHEEGRALTMRDDQVQSVVKLSKLCLRRADDPRLGRAIYRRTALHSVLEVDVEVEDVRRDSLRWRVNVA